MAFTIPIKVIVDADTTGLRRAMGPELDSIQRSIAQRASSAKPPRVASEARKKLGEAEGSYIGQVNEAQRKGLVDAQIGAQLRRVIRSTFDDMRTIMSTEINRAGGLLGPNGQPISIRKGTPAQIQRGVNAGVTAQAPLLASYNTSQSLRNQLAVARQGINPVSVQAQAASTAALLATAQRNAAAGAAQLAAQNAAASRKAIYDAAQDNLRQRANVVGATAPLIPAEGLVVRGEQTRRARVGTAAANAATAGDVKAEVDQKIAKERLGSFIRRQLGLERVRTGLIEETAAADLSVLNAKRLERSETRRLFQAQGGDKQGTLTQQILARTRQRQGGRIENPLDQQTFGQLAASRAITTASFGLTGGLLYGGLSFGKDILKESTQLQQELAIIRTQFELVDQTAAGVTFAQFRQQIQDTAIDTGVAADEVAKVQRQLAGAFASDQGAPNFAKAATEGRVALQYSQVSGLPQQEITDSLTAVSLAFRDAANVPLPFEDILDTITDLENRFGVLGPEILKFTADLAPLAAQLGLTQQQLAGLGAVAQQASGKTGAVLAEQLGRILPSLGDKKAEIIDLLEASNATAKAAPKISEAFARGQTDDVLRILIENYDKLGKTQKQTLASLVGGRREAATFYALLDRGAQTLAALDGKGGDSKGAFQKRWKSYQDTVTYAVSTMRRAIEEFGQLLFEAGIGDALVEAANAAKFFGGVASGLLVVIRELNGALGGMPAKAAGILALFKLLSVGGNTAARFLPFLAGGLRGAGGSFRGAGGIGSIYSRPTPILDAAGNRTGESIALRPSVMRAQNSATFGRYLNRNAQGEVIAGARTTAASIGATLAPVAAIMAASYATQKLSEVRQSLQENDAKVREQIQRAIEKGAGSDEIRRKFIEDKTGSNRPPPAPNKKGVADDIGRLNLGKITLAEAFQAVSTDPLSFGFRGETKAEGELRVAREELARLESVFYTRQLDALGKLRGTRAKGLVESINKDFASRFNGSSLSGGAVAALEKSLGFEAATNENGTPKLYGPETKGGKPQISIKRLQKLAEKIRNNPTDPGLQEAARFLLSFQIGSENRQLLQGVLDELAGEEAKTKNEIDAAERAAASEQQAGTFEQRLKNREAAYTGGTGTLAPVLSLIRKRLEGRRAEVANLVKLGLPSADEQAEVDRLSQLISSKTVEAADATRTLTDRTTSALGRSSGLEGAKRNYVGYKVAYDQIRADSETSATDRVKAALDVLDSQRKVFEEELAQATTPADIERVVTEAIRQQNDPGIRNDVVSGQLAIGDNSVAVQTLADFLGIDVESTRAIVTNAITGMGGVKDSVLRASLQAQRDQLKAVIDASKGQGIAGLELQSSQLAAVDAALAALDSANVTDPAAGTDEALKKAADDRKQKQQDTELQIRAAVEKDPVKKAKIEVERAQLQLKYADPGQETEAAVLAIVQANQAVADTVKSEAASVRQAGFELRKIHASGNPVAQAAIEAQAAAAQMADAVTDSEKAQAAVAIAQADESQRSAALAVVNARGSYTAALLSGDSVGQARQELANANAALGQARGEAERYAALQQVYEASQGLRESLLDVFIAQKDLAISVAEGAGDTVKVALLQLQQAQERLRSAQAAGVVGAQLDRLRAGVQTAQNNVTSVSRSDRMGDLEFLYDMGKITADELIKSLKLELAQIPITDKRARQEIYRRIKALRDEMSSGDLSMNIPDEIKLPTLYEARRLNQIASTSSGTSYVDARNIQITLNEAQDGQFVLDVLVAQMNSPARTGSATPSTASFYQ